MQSILIRVSLIFFFFTIFIGGVFAAYPKSVGYVNDFGKVLSKDFTTKLDHQLIDYKNKTTNEIAVTTIDTTGNQSIEEYAHALFNQWGIGNKEKENGVLLLFAMKDRHMRIEVGRGLEGDLTDIESKHVITDVITPEFKKQHYEQGIQKGVDAIVIAISTNSAVLATSSGDPTGFIIFIVFVVVLIILLLMFSPFTPLGGEGVWGVSGVWSAISDSDSDSGGGISVGGGASGGW